MKKNYTPSPKHLFALIGIFFFVQLVIMGIHLDKTQKEKDIHETNNSSISKDKSVNSTSQRG